MLTFQKGHLQKLLPGFFILFEVKNRSFSPHLHRLPLGYEEEEDELDLKLIFSVDAFPPFMPHQ
ncbi:hypothetical protein SESBI_50075 [Sesbania bispinosa]|nr:hypothetical protein SESBI_50075 [Sesbania bispinosa]